MTGGPCLSGEKNRERGKLRGVGWLGFAGLIQSRVGPDGVMFPFFVLILFLFSVFSFKL
jgi:hypothetical protein